MAADLDKDVEVDLVMANRDEENQIFLAKDAPGGVLDDGSLPNAPSIAPSRCPTTTGRTASSAPSGRIA